jgi:hypothetical protein
MRSRELILERFINVSDLPHLSTPEQCLYKLALSGEICKLRGRKQYQNFIDLFCEVLPANWGIIIFKPPRASLPLLCQLLEEELIRLLKLNNLHLIGSLHVQSLSKNHIKAMYPGDIVMSYWEDLEKNLVGNAAIYYLFQSLDKDDIGAKIETIRGWYRVDTNRNRYKTEEGLRSFYYRKVIETEGVFPYTTMGSDRYEDSGIHAPTSLTSRYLQILGTMGRDEQFADWVRTRLNLLET